MPLTVCECKRIPDDKPIEVWERILDSCERYSFFQTPRWSGMLEATIPNIRPMHCWFRFSDDLEAILPLFSTPKRFGISKLESLPWGTYGGLTGPGPYNTGHRKAAIHHLLGWLRPLSEINEAPSLSLPGENASHGQEKYRESATHILFLDQSFEDIFSNKFQARNRSAIRRARKNGVEITHSNNPECVDAVKALYENATKRWEGVETIPLSFFDTLTDLQENEVRIWLARCGENILAADIIFYGRGEAQYFAGASDPQFSRLNGSRLLMCEIIRDACERGYGEFNFGASGGLEGVEQFKTIFGGEKVLYKRYHFRHRWLQALYKLKY